MNNLKICASDCFDCETSCVSQFHENCKRTKLSCHAFDKQQKMFLYKNLSFLYPSRISQTTCMVAVCEAGCFAYFASFVSHFPETI